VLTLKVHIKEDKKKFSSEICLLSKDIYDDLKLTKGQLYTIHFGQLSEKVYINPQESTEENIYVPMEVFKNLLLDENLNLNIWKENDDIYLGPVVGIFVSIDHFWSVKGKERPSSAIQYIKASSKEGCFCYYFSLKDIDWVQNKIKGYSYIVSSKKWGNRWFPIPDVIYDRHGNFPNKDRKAMLNEIRTKLRNYKNIKFINSRNSLGGKWEECRRLSKYREIKDMIPETIVYKEFNDVVHMLNRHKFIFLKSIFGSLGTSVLSIKQEPEGYRINFNDSGLKEIVVKDILEVEKIISDFKGGRKFIIQQGIKLLKYNGRHFDLRMQMQKDDSGLWKAIIHYVRVAKGNFTITNYALGGEAALYQHIYPSLNNEEGKETIPDKDKLSDAAMKIANCIDREFGPQGELGIDLGIDMHGKMWFIEVNEKPSKDWNSSLVDIFQKNWIETLFEENKISGDYLKIDIDSIDGILPQAHCIFKYAKFLAISMPQIS